ANIPAPALDGELVGPGDDLRIVACPHPFRTDRTETRLRAGLTLAEILAEVQPEARLRQFAHISIEGEGIEQKNWRVIQPKHGHTVSGRIAPHARGATTKIPEPILLLAVAPASIAFPYLLPATAPAWVGLAGSAAIA